MASQNEIWRTITPDSLIAAIEHLRDTFDTSVWKCSRVTETLCFADLHPGVQVPDLPEFRSAFLHYKKIIGPTASAEFDSIVRVRTPPAVFKSYLDAFAAGLNNEVERVFDEILTIAIANSRILLTSSVLWTKEHLRVLIENNAGTLARWIKDVCDKQPMPQDIGGNWDFEEQVFWHSWRAPRFIHMQPSGNTPFDSASAWMREDEQRTRTLLGGLSNRFWSVVKYHLEEIAGNAHVRLAQTGACAADINNEGQASGETSAVDHLPSKYQGTDTVPQLDWQQVQIVFLSDERISIRAGTQSETRNYAEFGFEDQRNGKPNKAWEILREIAIRNGTLPDGAAVGRRWSSIEKSIQEIRKVLRKHFGLSTDPIPFLEGVGYQARPRITCGHSFNT